MVQSLANQVKIRRPLPRLAPRDGLSRWLTRVVYAETRRQLDDEWAPFSPGGLELAGDLSVDSRDPDPLAW